MLVTHEEIRELKQGAVLQAAHEMLEADSSLPIGAAIARAVAKADVEVPQHIKNAMASALFKLLVRGFPSEIDA